MEIVLLIVAVVILFFYYKYKAIKSQMKRDKAYFLENTFLDAIEESLDTGKAIPIRGGKWHWSLCEEWTKRLPVHTIQDNLYSSILNVEGEELKIILKFHENLSTIFVKVMMVSELLTCKEAEDMYKLHYSIIKGLSTEPDGNYLGIHYLGEGEDFMDNLLREFGINPHFNRHYSVAPATANAEQLSIFQRFTVANNQSEYLCEVFKDPFNNVNMTIEELDADVKKEREELLKQVQLINFS